MDLLQPLFDDQFLDPLPRGCRRVGVLKFIPQLRSFSLCHTVPSFSPFSFLLYEKKGHVMSGRGSRAAARHPCRLRFCQRLTKRNGSPQAFAENRRRQKDDAGFRSHSISKKQSCPDAIRSPGQDSDTQSDDAKELFTPRLRPA